MVEEVAMITSFGNDDTGRDRGNNSNTNKPPEGIVSIHLANCGDDCSNDDDRSVASFESTVNDRGTTDHDDLPGAEAPVVNSEFGNDNINENVEINDDGDGDGDGDGGDNNDNDDATIMSGNNKVENSEEEDSVPNNDDTNSTNPTDEDPTWMSLLAVADDDDDDDPGDYNKFRSDYDLGDDSVFENNDTSQGEGYVCMTVTDSWYPIEDDEYEDGNILLHHSIFNVGGNPSIHPNFFHGTLNDNLGWPYINDDPISETQVLHHALLKSLLRIKRGNIDNSIEHYDALWCKFQRIGIHNSIDYFHLDSNESLQLLLSSSGLPIVYQSTINSINLELIFAQQIQRADYSGNIIKAVCNVDTDLYNEELNTNGNENLVQICLQLANLQQKSFPNKWTNAVMRKLTMADIKSPSGLKYYIVSETLNPRLINAGGSGLHWNTQKGFLDLINGNQGFR